ncbi:MAG: OPT family oligopeptide transporter [bacterium]
MSEPSTTPNAAVDEGAPIYTPEPGETQLSFRAVLTGTLLGSVVCAMNIYFGLRTGWSIGGSLIAAILSYSIFNILKPAVPFSRLETNIAQTAGSAAGSMTSTAGLLAAIPAMMILGFHLGWLELYLWAASVAWLGVFFAVPLRRQMVLVEKLRFPTGTATANTIVAMYASGADALRKSRALLMFAAGAGAFTLAKHFLPELEEPPLPTWFASWFGENALVTTLVAVPAAYSFTVLISPLMLGAGVLIGMRVALSLLAGALVAWGVLAPMVEHWELVKGPTMSYGSGSRGWILWVGVAIMVADSLTQLALSWKTIVNTFRRTSSTGEAADTAAASEMIPNKWWIGGLIAATILTTISAQVVFDIPVYLTLIAIALSSILAAIAVRSTGETDINPIGGMGKVTQLVYGGIAPGAMATNLMAAGITGAGASQAGDMMQDLKTGHLLGASPRKQMLAQLFGIAGGILVCVPIYMLFMKAYGIAGMPDLDPAKASQAFPAPAAQAWKAMAELLSKGFDALPTGAEWGVLAGTIFGVALPVARKFAPDKIAAVLPSALAFGIAFIVPATYSVAMCAGAVIFYLWKRRSPKSATELGFAIASGLIAGEGLMGVVNSILTLLGIGGH